MIRYADYNDIPNIMQFIDRYWRKGHIMSKDRRLFEFQHLWESEVSFVISENKSKDLDGILGFIPYDDKNRDVMLAIWKTIKTDDTMLGIKMLQFLQNSQDVKSISAPGINWKTTRPIYHFLGFETGVMKHWYRLGKVDEYRIALVKDDRIPEYMDIMSGTDIQEYLDFESLLHGFPLEDVLIRPGHPYKSPEYLKRRYYRHPVFQYLKYGIKKDGMKLLIILRIQEYNGATALRLVDGIGDEELFRYFTQCLDGLIEKYHCEYADIYETGIDKTILKEAGWTLASETDNIIPEYFAPFERRNIDICYMSSIPDAVLFKADGDTDRPN